MSKSTKKTASKKAATNKPAAPKSGTRKPARPKPKKVGAEEHYRMIQEEAYFLAEQDGFKTGHEVGYWVQAEKAVAQRLK